MVAGVARHPVTVGVRIGIIVVGQGAFEHVPVGDVTGGHQAGLAANVNFTASVLRDDTYHLIPFQDQTFGGVLG